MAEHADNISAGMQVVSRVEVRGTNNLLVHPCGAVGVVTRTLAGEKKHFLVRFPDGFEFSLQREQLEVLKHFKARLDVAADMSRFTSRVPVRVEAHRGHLLAVGRGELPWAEANGWRKELHRDFEGALAETRLPERPDYESANRFLVRARRDTANQLLSRQW